MSFPGKYTAVLYIIVSIKLDISNDMDKGHYVYDVLDYNTRTWWHYDYDTINQYSGYPINVYDDLSIDKKQKKRIVCMYVSDRIVSMLYIKKDILESITYSFITGKSVSKYIEHIMESIAELWSFKE